MLHILRWFTKVTAFRLGLAFGLFFAALFAWQLATRTDIPILSSMEEALEDVKFHQRGPVANDGKVVVAAIDEAAIARFGRFPWDRHVLAELVDKLSADGAQAIGFDMTLADEDLGAQFAGAKRFRSRFSEVSLAEGKGRAAVDRISEATADVAGAESALDALGHEVKPEGEPIFRTARGRLDDGKAKLVNSQADFEMLEKQQENFAKELESEIHGDDPDHALGAAFKRAGNVVLGFHALTEPETRAFQKGDIEADAKRVSQSAIAPPEVRYVHRITNADGSQASITSARPVARAWIKEYSALLPPLLPIAEGAANFGFFNNLPDSDGVIRNTALVIKVSGEYMPSLDVMLVAQVLGVKPDRITPVVSDDTGAGNLDGVDFDGKLYVPTDWRGLMRINYYGKDGTFANYSVADIIDGHTPPGALKNKIVLVGATAEGTFDQRVTPFMKNTAGIETHANAVQTMLDRRFLRLDSVVSGLEAIFLVLLAVGFALIFSKVRVLMSIPTVLFGGAAIWGASFLLFRMGYDVFAALPLVELGVIFIVVIVFRFFTEERDKRQLRRAFQLYLNPDVMEEMLAQPEKLQLGGTEKPISVLFSDIRGFTTISEKLSPQALVHLLNAYLTPMTDIVFARRGTLDKYIGDAVMAFFGAPIENKRNALDACEAALDMMETLRRLRETWHIEDPQIPDVDIGIGINSGPMVVGNMGSLQRFNYTVMGDNVNLASRLEGLNKEYGTHVLISEATLQAARVAGGPDCLAVRELDLVRVKGKKEPVRLFELRGKGLPLTADKPLLEAYAEAIAFYRSGKFSEARAGFERCLREVPGDGPAKEFLARTDALLANPPGQEWDGVKNMEHK